MAIVETLRFAVAFRLRLVLLALAPYTLLQLVYVHTVTVGTISVHHCPAPRMGLGVCQVRKRPSGPDRRVEKRCQHYELCEGCQTEWVFKYRPQCSFCSKLAEVVEAARHQAAEEERLTKVVRKSTKDEVKHQERNKKVSEKTEARQNRTAARLKLKFLLPIRLRPIQRSEPSPTMVELDILEDMPNSHAPEQKATGFVEMVEGPETVVAEPTRQFAEPGSSAHP